MTLSIVTVCMNRRHHLLVSAAQVAAWPWHAEHLVVDWSSREPLRRADLPADPRLRLLRVEGESAWNPSRAYNFALRRAEGEWLCRMDADCWPTQALVPEGLLEAGRVWVGEGREGRYGQFLMERATFEAIGGYNEFMRGWGFEDKDLRARLEIQAGLPLASIPEQAIGVIPHGDAERIGAMRRGPAGGLEATLALAAMRASRLGNRLTAAHCPWGARTPASRYREMAPGHWRVDPATVPLPPGEAGEEIENARRRAFWSCFLAIPDVFLTELPLKLVPYARQGRWDVRWWHRLWFRTGRRLLHLPVLLLALGRGRLAGARRLAGG
jgi:hypothetical protein